MVGSHLASSEVEIFTISYCCVRVKRAFSAMCLKHIVSAQMIVVGIARLHSVEGSEYSQEVCSSLLISFPHISEVRKPKQLAGL